MEPENRDNFISKVFAKSPGSPRGGWYWVFQCLFCQKPYIAKGYEVNSGKYHKYCSNECQSKSEKRIENARKARSDVPQDGENNPNYKDGRSFYSKYRKDACEICGSTKGRVVKGKEQSLFVHHCDGDRTNSSPDNLKTVCHACHMNIHNPSKFGDYPEYQKW